MHYTRWRKHGDPLAGRTPNGETLRFLNEVVFAYEGIDCLFWPYYRDNITGYARINIDGTVKLVSRISCERENGPEPTPGMDAAHSCGNGHLACVARKHLRWATRKQNKNDELIHGTRNSGKRNGQAVLTDEQVREIRTLKGRLNYGQISAMFGISRTLISFIMNGKRWSHLI